MPLTKTVIACRVCTRVLAHWSGHWIALTCVGRPAPDGLAYVPCPDCGAITQYELVQPPPRGTAPSTAERPATAPLPPRRPVRRSPGARR